MDVLDRDDVLVAEVPSESVGFITGYRGESLRRIEASSGTFCFTDGGKVSWLMSRSIGWLVGWLVGGLVSWSVGRFVDGRMVGRSLMRWCVG